MTTLVIREVVTYRIEHEDGPYETMREFLRDPHHHLTGVEERDVQIVEPELPFEEEVAAHKDIARAEMDS